MEPLAAEPDVRAVEAAGDDDRIAHSESRDDLLANRRRGGGRERKHGRSAELLDDGTEPEVIGPEVVAPLAHAVGFVYDEERRLRVSHVLERLFVRVLLERQETNSRSSSASASNASRRLPARTCEFTCAAPPASSSSSVSTWSR